MFNLFSKNSPEKPQDVKAVREALLAFMKQELQKLEGGEGKSIKGFNLYIACLPVEKYLYESAVFADEDGRFKKEIQRLADDFAIDLPEHWTFDALFVDELPLEVIKMKDLNVALYIKTPEHLVNQRSEKAFIRVLNGEAERGLYTITSKDSKINIGREKRAQVTDGSIRINDIAFPDSSSNQCNKFVSRQHAHLEWNNEDGHFMLFADDGGIPPGNKLKIRSKADHSSVKLTFTELGHALMEGDQIILGDSAVLEFSYQVNKE
jgi:hypothetical protein